MAKTDKEILDNYKARVKAQNEAAKENWDTVSCRLPKGTKDRIKALGLTVNGVINDCVLKFLDTAENAQNAPTSGENVKADKIIDEPAKDENVAFDNTEDLLKIQAEIREKKAKQDEQEENARKAAEERKAQEQEENKAVIRNILESAINGTELHEDAEKEELRQQSFVKDNMV